METERIEHAIEHALVNIIRKGDLFTVPYDKKIDVSNELKTACNEIDYKKVYQRIKDLLEEKLAEKIVNKIVTEMGTDIKKLMQNETIRDDFRFLMRKGVEEIMTKARE